MSIRPPPRYYNVPTRARFRKYRLPKELFYTFDTLLALAWTNKYEFTPPLINAELAHMLDLEERALQAHTARLRAWGWIEKIEGSRSGNVYRLTVPEDLPASIGLSDSTDGRERGTDLAAGSTGASADDHNGDGCIPLHPKPSINVVADVVQSSNSLHISIDSQSPSAASLSGAIESNAREENQTTTTANSRDGRDFAELIFRGRCRQSTGNTFHRTHTEIDMIVDALTDLEILDEESQDEILALAHVTPEYVEDWTLYKKYEGSRLGGGYYRMQIRERRRSAYSMGESQRRRYRQDKQEQWEISEMERQGQAKLAPPIEDITT